MVTSIIGIRTTRINGIPDTQTPLMGPQKRQQIMKAIHFFLFHLLVCCQAPRQLWAFFISAWRWSSGVLQSSRYLSTNCKTVLNLSFFRLLSMSLRKLFHFSWSFFLSSSAENLSKNDMFSIVSLRVILKRVNKSLWRIFRQTFAVHTLLFLITTYTIHQKFALLKAE